MRSVLERFPDGRRFAPWAIAISHSQLLLRSARSEFGPNPLPRQIDLAFYGVTEIHVARWVVGVSALVVEDDTSPHQKVFILEAEEGHARIVAGRHQRLDYEGDFTDPSPIMDGSSFEPRWWPPNVERMSDHEVRQKILEIRKLRAAWPPSLEDPGRDDPGG